MTCVTLVNHDEVIFIDAIDADEVGILVLWNEIFHLLCFVIHIDRYQLMLGGVQVGHYEQQ